MTSANLHIKVSNLWKITWNLLLLLHISNSHSHIPDGKLTFAHTICRHGDRNILRTYPDDPWKSEDHWPGGFGQLTNLGKQQHFLLGQYLRRRYASLLGNGDYSPNKVYIQSTDIDRVIASGQANLAGIFPPAPHQIWNSEIFWQPIPIHTKPSPEDYLLASSKKCDRFDYEMIKYLNQSDYKGLFKYFNHTIEYLEQKAKVKLSSLLDIMFLYDALLVEKLNNKDQPEWMQDKKIDAELEFLAILWYQIHTATVEMKRIKSGFLLKDIFDRFSDKIQSELSPDRSLWMYFAHDITIVGLLNSLGLYKMHTPTYASCLFFELYKTNYSDYVQIFYKNSIDTHIPPLKIPHCGTKCPLEKLYRLYQDILPTQSFDEICKLHEGEVIPQGGNPEDFSL